MGSLVLGRYERCQSLWAAERGRFVVAADGTGLTRLTDDIPTQLQVSPDGAWVAHTPSFYASSVYELHGVSTTGTEEPMAWDASGFEPTHDTSGLRLDAITPDSAHLVFGAGASGDPSHMPLLAWAFDGDGTLVTLVSISGWPTLRTASFAGITADSAWVVYGVPGDVGPHLLGAASLTGEPDRDLLGADQPRLPEGIGPSRPCAGRAGGLRGTRRVPNSPIGETRLIAVTTRLDL